jgi:hypothetical protein
VSNALSVVCGFIIQCLWEVSDGLLRLSFYGREKFQLSDTIFLLLFVLTHIGQYKPGASWPQRILNGINENIPNVVVWISSVACLYNLSTFLILLFLCMSIWVLLVDLCNVVIY